jgi:putative spermidine/putrescine transport system permease protein
MSSDTRRRNHLRMGRAIRFERRSKSLRYCWMSNDTIDTARSLGAARPLAFLLVTLPQVRFAVATTAALSFLTTFDEVVVAMFISSGDNSTLTRTMFNALRDQVDPTIAAISTVMIVNSSLLVVLSQVLGRSRL